MYKPGKTEQSRKYAEAHGIETVDIKLSGAYPSYRSFIARWISRIDIHSELYQDYMAWRKIGLRAVTAYGVAKYGWSFMVDYLRDEE